MNAHSETGVGKEELMACGFFTVLSGALALPSLCEAWMHDLYAVGGWIAWLIWLLSLGITSARLRRKATGNTITWIVLAATLCGLGALTTLRIFYHLAFASALCGIAAPANRAWLAVVGALSWLPASGWLISRWHIGGMVGWERPALAATVGLTSFLLMKSDSNQDNHEI